MIVNGILFKEDLNMSDYSKFDLVRCYNPESLDKTVESIGEGITKRSIPNYSEGIKIISYEVENNKELMENIYKNSVAIQQIIPNLYKCVKVSDELLLTAIPYVCVESEYGEDCEEDISEEQIESFDDLNRKIMETIKEVSRVTVFLNKLFPEENKWLDHAKDYVNSYFKFSTDDYLDDEIMSSADKILGDIIGDKDFEKRLNEFLNNNSNLLDEDDTDEEDDDYGDN